MSMDLGYMEDNESAVDQSILMKQTNLNDQTILDYRDFLARNMDERSNSIYVHQDAFVVDQGLKDLSECDLDELSKHMHSDHDSDIDEDPFYEYNQC